MPEYPEIARERAKIAQIIEDALSGAMQVDVAEELRKSYAGLFQVPVSEVAARETAPGMYEVTVRLPSTNWITVHFTPGGPPDA